MDNMNTRSVYKKIGGSIIAITIWFLPLVVHASVLSISAPTMTSVGERISVDIYIDPEQTTINSVASSLQFSSNLSFNGFSAQQSSIPIWIESPAEKTTGVISFSGVVPGGLERLYDPLHPNNHAIPLVRLFFISKAAGTAAFTFGADSSVLRNDGKGTPTLVTTIPATSTVTDNVKKSNTTLLDQDTTRPEPFTITVIDRSLFGRTPRLAIFTANDAEGGIEHYEVRVGTLGFVRATSPFVIPYRLFSFPLTVRAIDYSGNIQEQQITVPAEDGHIAEDLLLIVVVLLLGFFGYRFYNKRKI